MDLSEPGPQPEVSEQSGEYRLRFRYQLWSQAAQDFRLRPVASRRFVSTGRNSGGADLKPRSAERRDALDSHTTPAPEEAG
jgi:hypothetical protein